MAIGQHFYPTGVLPGFGNQREVELAAVEAGFSPIETIHIVTQNGARFLGLEAEIGTLAVGKRALPRSRSSNADGRIAAIWSYRRSFRLASAQSIGCSAPDSMRAYVSFSSCSCQPGDS